MQLKIESKNLELFEIERQLTEFLKSKGITASISKDEAMFKIFISSYASDKTEDKKAIDAAILTFVKGLSIKRDIELAVAVKNYGYDVILGNQIDGAKLLEGKAEDDKQHQHACCLCAKTFTGYGNDPWPVDTMIGARCCDECNIAYVIPARFRKVLAKNVDNRTEAVSRQEVENETSNTILDNKYIWLFNVIAEDGTDLEEGIEYLQDAIEILIEKNGTYLVAFPYVDPKPGDASVDLVFADNPGPVVIYNREEVTKNKVDLAKPTSTKQPKTESTQSEQVEFDADKEYDTPIGKVEIATSHSYGDKYSYIIMVNGKMHNRTFKTLQDARARVKDLIGGK